MEKVFAISMFRDEEDVAQHVLVHLAAEGVDGIIVADNRSVDGTREQLEIARARIRAIRPEVYFEVIDDPEVGYYQSRKMTALAQRAVLVGASWIIPFDADEIWHAPRGRLADWLRSQGVSPETTAKAPAKILNHFSTGLDDPRDPLAFRRFGWHIAEPAPLPKVAFRWQIGAVIHQGNHGVDLPRGCSRTVPGVVVRHFPYRSFERFAQKSRNGKEAYDAAPELHNDMGGHWRAYGQVLAQHGVEALRGHWDRWFHFENPRDPEKGMNYSPAPLHLNV